MTSYRWLPWRRISLAICVISVLGCALPAQATRPDGSNPAAPEYLFARAIKQGMPYTVQIETVGGAQPLERPTARRRQQEGAPEDDAVPTPRPFQDGPGSGFMIADGPTTGIVYSADGLILTSSFNFVREPSIVTVRLGDGRQMRAEVVGRDQVRKLALLKIEATDLPTPDWTPRDQIRPGQWAISLGRGFGGAEPVVSVGVVSAVNRMMGNAIQTDAKLSPANYGGPLLDSAGRVLGICVPMAQRPGELAGIELYDSGVGFAIPGWRVSQIVERLAEGTSFRRGWLGTQIDPHTKRGVRILRSADPSPMRAAGAEDGDLIVEINGRLIKHYGQLVTALYMLPAGEQVRVRLLRGADYIDLDVVLASSDDLGPLPPLEEPFDPAEPLSQEEPAPGDD